MYHRDKGPISALGLRNSTSALIDKNLLGARKQSMANRAEIFSDERLGTLLLHHPYLLLFQKEDWREYLLLFAQIYDVLEEDIARLPFDVLKTLALKFYSQKGLGHVENKVHAFFHMAIGELQVLKDSHDQFGQRFLEPTRAGKQLLQLSESLLERRVRFTGTGAETLLGALNDILASRTRLSEAEAIEHHRQKIKAYQDDIKRIQQNGVASAELLPIPHSNEALFSQAEEAATHILAAIEDVKSAIEKQRQDLAQSYFDGARSAGQSVEAMAEFYERLYSSTEYTSYNQAKSLLSHLEGFAARFASRDIDRILLKIREKDLVSKEDLARSMIPNFMESFRNADHSIQEKIKTQIRLLQQQVHYALHTDVLGLQTTLHSALGALLQNRDQVGSFFSETPVEIEIPADFDPVVVSLSEFPIPAEIENTALEDARFEAEEMRALFETLLQAEETTLSAILSDFRAWIKDHPKVALSEYPFRHGIAEYYVLSEIEAFAPDIEKYEVGCADLPVTSKSGEFIIRDAKIFQYFETTDGLKGGL